MATITLKYDARNTIAKKTLDYILSLGVFKNVADVELSESMDTKEDLFYKNFNSSLKEASEIVKGKKKGILLDKTLHEL